MSEPLSDVAEANDEAASPPAAGKRRGAKLYFAVLIAGQAATLVRYVVMARLLGPEQLGLAATLALTSSFFELISDTGSDRFLIQDRLGDTEAMQKLVQFVLVVRGLMIAGCLAAFSIPLANFYKAPQLAVGFVVLAISPLVSGFVHMDYRRAQRNHDFRPESICSIVSTVVGLVTTVTAAWFTRNFTAALYGSIIGSVVLVATSHLLAKRRYALGWDPVQGRRMARFSAPLTVSGLMLYMGSQGDRIMVSRELGVAALGEYSAIILLIYYPAAILLRYMHVLFMPILAAGRDDPKEMNRLSNVMAGQTIVLGIAMAVGFALVAPLVVPRLYGARFQQAPMLIGLIGVLQAARFLINWPTTVALSVGQSRTVLVSNIMRLSVFPGAYVGFRLHGGLPGMVAGYIAGEALSVAVSILLLNRNTNRATFAGVDRLVMFLGFAGAIVGWNLVASRPSLALATGVALYSTGLVVWLLVRERSTLAEAIAVAARYGRALPRRLAPDRG